MTKYLVVLIWPAGLAVLAAGAYLFARRQPDAASLTSDSPGLAAGRHHGRSASPGAAVLDAIQSPARLVVLVVVGAVIAFGLMSLLGLAVVYHGLTIDRPVFTWLHSNHVHVMTALMKRLTKIGDTWTTWGAAAAAAVCLAVSWRARRWLPPVALASLIVVDHYTTLALRHEFHRLGPPASPLGTYPSGGCDRSVAFYGLIAYLLWREFSGRRATAVWAGAAVAALGFNEAYSRVYLSLHWLTDALSGLFYGTLLLAAFIAAIHLVAGGPQFRPVGLPGAESAVRNSPEGSVA